MQFGLVLLLCDVSLCLPRSPLLLTVLFFLIKLKLNFFLHVLAFELAAKAVFKPNCAKNVFSIATG